MAPTTGKVLKCLTRNQPTHPMEFGQALTLEDRMWGVSVASSVLPWVRLRTGAFALPYADCWSGNVTKLLQKPCR